MGQSGVPSLAAVLPIHTSRAGLGKHCCSAPGCCTEPGLQQLHRCGCHPVASANSAWPSACSMHPLRPNMLNSQRNFFFFYTKLWWLVCDSDPRPAFLADKGSREVVSPDFSLFSFDFPFLSYLSCMQTHATKILPYLLHLQELTIISLPPCTHRDR